MPLWYSNLRRVIAMACVALFGLSQVHAEEFRPTRSSIFFSSQLQTTMLENGVGVLDRGSTLGFGTEISRALSRKLDLRIGFNDLRDFDRLSKKGINQHFDLKLRSTSFLLDWHPLGGSFRTTIGVLIGRHRLRADALPTQVFHLDRDELSEVTFGSHIDLPDTILSDIEQTAIRRTLNNADANGNIKARDLLSAGARVTFSSLMPYLGIGWGNATRGDRRLHYTFDLGVAFHGSPEVDLDVQGIIADVAREQASQEVQAFLSSEEKRLEDELASLDVFPVVSFGLSYRF